MQLHAALEEVDQLQVVGQSEEVSLGVGLVEVEAHVRSHEPRDDEDRLEEQTRHRSGGVQLDEGLETLGSRQTLESGRFADEPEEDQQHLFEELRAVFAAVQETHASPLQHRGQVARLSGRLVERAKSLVGEQGREQVSLEASAEERSQRVVQQQHPLVRHRLREAAQVRVFESLDDPVHLRVLRSERLLETQLCLDQLVDEVRALDCLLVVVEDEPDLFFRDDRGDEGPDELVEDRAGLGPDAVWAGLGLERFEGQQRLDRCFVFFASGGFAGGPDRRLHQSFLEQTAESESVALGGELAGVGDDRGVFDGRSDSVEAIEEPHLNCCDPVAAGQLF